VEDWVENRPTRGWRALDVAEVWRYRHLVAVFARRDVTVRYRQAALGAAWAVLLPLSGAAVFTVAFSRLAGIDTGATPYLVFAYAGWVGWTYFSGALQGCSASLVRNADLVTKVWFPRLTAPLAALLPGLADLGVALLALIPLCVAYGVAPGPGLLLLPAALVLLAATALGVGLALGTAHVRFRDVGHLLGLLVQLWLFASPVAYPSSLLSADQRWLYYLNPVAGAIDLLRYATLDAPSPGLAILVSAAVAAAFLVLGAAVFARGERRFADVI
jgi:ABC-type polysaccharide/polyol phosphate export permease